MDSIASPPDSALVNEHASQDSSRDSDKADSKDATVNTQNVHDTDAEGDGHDVAGNEAWARRLNALN
ncbi:MAG: hypothetical protein PSX37_00325 [bacterium]|nr:hypothetical protein [bacterium]